MSTTASNATYSVVTLTGATLVGADGRHAGPEVGRVISTHRTLAAAERALARAQTPAGPRKTIVRGA